MEQRIKECLDGKNSTEYVFPFFWQHGEDHTLLLEELEAIYHCGITDFCVESRPHEHFCEEQWWDDLSFLLAEAKKREMHVWVLDDKKFPTGYANNYIESHPKLRAVRLRMEFRDFAGSQADTALIPVPLAADEKFVSITAYQRVESGNYLVGDGISLMSKQKNGLIWWDIPEGVWRVYYVIRTLRAPVEMKKNYIDIMSKESCKAMIHAVYEPHYQHFKEYFGNTFVGFFSDEAGFSNEIGHYHSTLGREEMLIPWNDSVAEIMAEKTGFSLDKVLNLLPALWHEIDICTPAIRESYMEVASDAYSKNFNWMLGNWCREHGVMYCGHIIEDQNAHQRLGYGAGHFFRSMDGQDIAGCDIVLHQMIPGLTTMDHSACIEGKRANPEFFLYTLPKLASSHAHIQPLKKGRAVCEIFGGFGWAEGLWQMKQMTDLMLVGGINHFIPHAFNAKFPDMDLPPHFYAHGMNVQYPLFQQLMGYMQRMSHTLSGGVHQADIAVYYNAEAEWAGGKCMLLQKVCKELSQHQIDFDILPQDVICKDAAVTNRCLVVNGETYGALVVPYSQYLPGNVLEAFGHLADGGVPVWFVDGYPDASILCAPVDQILKNCNEISLSKLAETLENNGLKEIHMTKDFPLLRTFHTKQGDYHVFMLWNEDIFSEIDTDILFPDLRPAVFYDAWKNKVYAVQQNGNAVRIRLAPAESIVICFGEWEDELPEYDYRDNSLQKLQLNWKIALRKPTELEFSDYPLSELKNLAACLPYFNGVVRYESIWDVEYPEKYHVLEVERVGETAQLWINDEYCGAVISKPYRFEIGDNLKAGKNQLRIEVRSNLSYEVRDFMSSFLPLQPLGLMGDIFAG